MHRRLSKVLVVLGLCKAHTARSKPQVPIRVSQFAALGIVGLLAACADSPHSTVPVAQEAATYRAHAKSYYAPPGPPDDPWGPYIMEASKRFDLPDVWIRSVMARESGGRLFRANGDFVTSAPGAMGLMQLMPPTYDEMRAEYDLGDDPFDPHDNIMAGTAYLRQMYDIYGSPGFLAAYNGGPGRLDDFLTRHRTLPRETRNYVAAIGRQIAGIYPKSRSQADLMVASHDPSQGTAYASAQPNPEAQSVSAAWASRAAKSDDNDDQPVQVAEAAPVTNEPAPGYTKSWSTVSPNSSANSVAAAWAARKPQATPSAVTQVADAAPAGGSDSPADVRSAWAARGITSPTPSAPDIPAPAVVAAAPPARPSRFRLVSSAMAEPAPLLRSSTRGGAPKTWAIQVGAFGSASLASQAAGHAQSKASDLGGAKTQVASVHAGRSNLYRARLTGLSHDAAVAACQKLARTGECVVVSPGSSF